MRKAERAWFLSEGEESEALRINGARPHFLLLCPQVENVLFLTKWGLAPFILGQKQRVLEPYSRSPSSMVAATISQNLCPEHKEKGACPLFYKNNKKIESFFDKR